MQSSQIRSCRCQGLSKDGIESLGLHRVGNYCTNTQHVKIKLLFIPGETSSILGGNPSSTPPITEKPKRFSSPSILTLTENSTASSEPWRITIRYRRHYSTWPCRHITFLLSCCRSFLPCFCNSKIKGPYRSTRECKWCPWHKCGTSKWIEKVGQC